jgi:hypothetical protein
MSLMKLLSVSKSFAGGKSQLGRYKMAEQGLLPKFAPMGRAVSLAPNRKSDEPATLREANGTPTIQLNSRQQQIFPMADPAAKPVNAIEPTPRAAVCRNATATPTNWFRLDNRPFFAQPAASPKTPPPTQAELSLDAVKPVRNDLSDSDLQIVTAKPASRTGALKPPRSRLFKPELTGLAWSRLTARFLNSQRVRA